MNLKKVFAPAIAVVLMGLMNVSVMAGVPSDKQSQGENTNPITNTNQPQGCARC